MNVELEITHPDGTTEVLPLTALEEHDEYREKRTAVAFATRDDVHDLSQLHLGLDEVEATADTDVIFGGALVDEETTGALKKLHLETYEFFAEGETRTGGGERWINADDTTIINDAIDDIDKVTAGTIENVGSGLDFVFSHVSPAKKIRTVAEATGAEVAYNDDGTLDYVESLGTDKSATVISPSEGNIEGEVSTEVEGALKYTHLRVVGAGEGPAQRWVDVEADGYTAGDPQRWGTYSNKDLKHEGVLQTWGEALLDELNEEAKHYNATTRDVEINRGDTVTCEEDADNFSEELRATKLTRVYDSQGAKSKVECTNRAIGDVEQNKLIEDADRYNLAFEGDAVWATPGGSRQPVNGASNYQMSFYYPNEIEYEHRVKLQVKGLAYRAYSSGSEAGGTDSDTTQAGGTDSDTTQAGGTDSDTTQSASPLPETESRSKGTTDSGDTTSFAISSDAVVGLSASGRVPDDSSVGPYEVEIDPTGASSQSDTFAADEEFSFDFEVPAGNHSGSIDVDITVIQSDPLDTSYVRWYTVSLTAMSPHGHQFDWLHSHQFDWSHSHEFDWLHGHSPDPGLVEFGEYPSQCDVIVNGNPQGVSLGDGTGPFESTVDLEGTLDTGGWNTIEISSDSLGHIQAIMDIDVYRQILGDG